MSKVRRRFQFGMSSVVLLMTVVCVGVRVYQTWASKIEVLVATENLDHKTAISKTNVKFETWPVELVPEGAITSSEGIPVGDVIVVRLRKGQAIIGEDVVDPATILHNPIPPGYRVVNVKLPTIDGLSGLLSPGDRMDVIVVGPDGTDDGSTTLFRDVRVFNVGQGIKAWEIVGLLLTDKQATTIAEPKAVGKIRLTLRSVGR